jgi:hypothetical protein
MPTPATAFLLQGTVSAAIPNQGYIRLENVSPSILD